jgi:hypothetical protein
MLYQLEKGNTLKPSTTSAQYESREREVYDIPSGATTFERPSKSAHPHQHTFRFVDQKTRQRNKFADTFVLNNTYANMPAWDENHELQKKHFDQ